MKATLGEVRDAVKEQEKEFEEGIEHLEYAAAGSYGEMREGDPKGAATQLLSILDDVEEALQTAGPFLAPGFRNSFVKAVQEMKGPETSRVPR